MKNLNSLEEAWAATAVAASIVARQLRARASGVEKQAVKAVEAPPKEAPQEGKKGFKEKAKEFLRKVRDDWTIP